MDSSKSPTSEINAKYRKIFRGLDDNKTGLVRVEVISVYVMSHGVSHGVSHEWESVDMIHCTLNICNLTLVRIYQGYLELGYTYIVTLCEESALHERSTIYLLRCLIYLLQKERDYLSFSFKNSCRVCPT